MVGVQQLGRCLSFLDSRATEEDDEEEEVSYEFYKWLYFKSKTESKCKFSAMPCFINKNVGVSPVDAVYLEENHLKCTCVFFGKGLCTKVGAWLNSPKPLCAVSQNTTFWKWT